MQGYTSTSAYSIAPRRSARVKEIAVTLGATVNTGDVIVRLEADDLEDQLATANAERRIVTATMVAETARLRRDSVDRERRFASGTERASASLVTAEANAHTAAAELAAIDAELVEQTDLVSKHLADASRLNALQLRRASLAKQVDAASAVLRTLRGNASAASRRSNELGDETEEDRLAPLQARLQAADLKIAQLLRDRDELTLRAPAAGVVEALPLRAGDLAAPQTPVAVLVVQDSRRVVACIPEVRANSVVPGLEADVTSMIDRAHAAGEVESITGAIAPLPPRCQPPGAKTPLMGRVAIISLDEPLGGLPGQTQLVSFSARRRPHERSGLPPKPPAPAPVPEAGPVELAVPSELAKLAFEPSGLVWLSAIDRYVIVSDETGPKAGNRHPPWLYTMTSTGAVDPRPLEISGVDELDDLESITADDRGGLWLLASGSVSRKGNRPVSRRRLAHVIVEAPRTPATLDGVRLHADRVVDLGELLDRAPDTLRRELGVPDTRELDLEAMAFRGGALYLGLKAPLDGAGRAAIWRVGVPAKLLAGELEAAQLAVWATISLTVDVDGKPVPGGFADLIFWDDNTLVFGVTASTDPGSAEDGSVYVAAATGGALAPQLVRTFSRLKPEGLARGPRGELAVVFDRGHRTPMWIELPAPSVRRRGP